MKEKRILKKKEKKKIKKKRKINPTVIAIIVDSIAYLLLSRMNIRVVVVAIERARNRNSEVQWCFAALR